MGGILQVRAHDGSGLNCDFAFETEEGQEFESVVLLIISAFA